MHKFGESKWGVCKKRFILNCQWELLRLNYICFISFQIQTTYMSWIMNILINVWVGCVYFYLWHLRALEAFVSRWISCLPCPNALLIYVIHEPPSICPTCPCAHIIIVMYSCSVSIDNEILLRSLKKIWYFPLCLSGLKR